MSKKRGYSNDDAWRETGETRDATRGAWHQARTDAQRSGEDLGNRKDNTDADYRPSWDSGKGGERYSDSGKDSDSGKK